MRDGRLGDGKAGVFARGMTDASRITDHASLATLLERLRGRYGSMPWRPHGDALTELVLTILSQHTNDTNSGGAFASMQRAFPSWDDMLRADDNALAESIRRG